MQKFIEVKDLRHLDELINKNINEYVIILGVGLKSSKNIVKFKTKYQVMNYVDGSLQLLTAKGLYTKSNIGEAIDKKSFYAEL